MEDGLSIQSTRSWGGADSRTVGDLAVTDEDKPHFVHANMVAAMDGTKIEEWTVPPGFVAQLRTAVDELQQGHEFRGLFVSKPEPVFLFKVRDSVQSGELRRVRPKVIPWGWPGAFGSCFTLTCHFTQTASCRVTLTADDDEAFEAISRGPVKWLFLRGHHALAGLQLDFTSAANTRENFAAHVAEIKNHSASLYRDDAAAFWETMGLLKGSFADWTAMDQLQLGWFDVYKETAEVFADWLQDFRKGCPITNLRENGASGAIVEFFDMICAPGTDVRVLLDHVHEKFGSKHGELAAFLNDGVSFRLKVKKQDPLDEAVAIASETVNVYNLCPVSTDCGRLLPWFDFVNRDFAAIELQPKDISATCPPREYWRRVGRGGIRFGWGYVMSGGQAPVSKEFLVNHKEGMPRADEFEAVDASANALFQEAVANKRGTIPKKAHVQLQVGPFTHVEMTEYDPNVLVVFWTADGEALYVVCEPVENACNYESPGEKDPFGDDRDIECAIKLLLAATIRDFWVVENREMVFEERSTERSGARVSSDEPRVVYIPRVQYIGKPDTDRCEAELDQHERRAHHVRPHLRKVANPSPFQVQLADRYGLFVPLGYTFVKPHERGKGKRDVVYRSRSALRSLYTASVVGATAPSRWFQFERDVHQLMESLGFAIEHIASARRGDSGVDVYATKGSGLDEVQWVIQCKCWKPKRKIYPNTVRELIGVLSEYPQGVRGMIVTTSSFSSGAVEAAIGANIKMIDGAEFISLVNRFSG